MFTMLGFEAVDESENHRFSHGILSRSQTLDLILLGNLVMKAPKNLLKKCPFFENMFNSAPDQRTFETDDGGVAVKAFLEFLRGEVPYPENAFAHVRFGLKIKDTAFIKACVLNAKTYSIPPGFSSKNAIPISKAIINSLPSRRISEYDSILRGVETECQCEQREYVENIMDELRRKCTQPELPMVPLFEKKLTLAIMAFTPGDNPEMAALISGMWQPIEIAGCTDLEDICEFHLVFGKHLIYALSPDKAVYVKNLSSEDPPVRFCERSKIFRSHFGNLVVVTQEEDVDTLYIWSVSTMEFENIFANPSVEIRNVSWPRDSKNRKKPLRILTEDDETILIDQTGRYLALAATGKKVADWVNNFCLLDGEEEYRSKKDNSWVLSVAEKTHVGFSNVSVSAKDEDIGVYETEVNGIDVEGMHGKVYAISDVYLGIDHITQLSCTQSC